MVVADVGAGSGYHCFLLAPLVGKKGKVIAFDIQQEMLDLITKKAKKQNVANIETVKGTETDPKLPDGERGPDPAGGRLPRVQSPVRDDREDGRGPQARRAAGVRRVPPGGPEGADQARPQDERAAGAQGDGRVPRDGAHEDGRHPAVAARHHLHEEGPKK